MATKKERIAVMSSILTMHPYQFYTLTEFERILGAAKSSISEDLAAIRQAFEDHGLGTLETRNGTHGGVRYVPGLETETNAVLKEIVERLSEQWRILPGRFLYLSDIFSTPRYVDAMAHVIASKFQSLGAALVVTMEMKGIPLAASVARLLDLPLAIARHDSKFTDGPTLTSHYLSGTSRRLQTLSISRRMLQGGGPAVIVDDFIGGGGTTRAMSDALGEFGIEVLGVAAALVRRSPQKKKISGYSALFVVDELTDDSISISLSSPDPSE